MRVIRSVLFKPGSIDRCDILGTCQCECGYSEIAVHSCNTFCVRIIARTFGASFGESECGILDVMCTVSQASLHAVVSITMDIISL